MVKAIEILLNILYHNINEKYKTPILSLFVILQVLT